RQLAIELTAGLEDKTAQARSAAALGPGPDPNREKGLQQQVSAALASDDDAARALVLSYLLPEVPASQSAELYDLMLHSCLGLTMVRKFGSTRERQRISRDFMLDRIGNCGQVLQQVGGGQLVAATVRAIQDVTGRWS